MKSLTPNSERERYYLLPGQGGRNLRQKRNSTLIWAVFVGLIWSTIVAALLYGIHTLRPIAP